MIEFGREYYNNDMYFFLKKRKDSIDVYYSVGNTITEARTMDEIVKIPLINETKLKLVIEKLTKSKKKFSKKDIKRIMDKISSEKEEAVSGKENAVLTMHLPLTAAIAIVP
jgi:uncharacterized protein YneF (UPF0154 family)